jgi:predicted nucleotidyltransferase
MTQNDFRQRLMAHLHDHPEAHFAILFGSAVEGEHFRDLDVGVWVDRALVPAERDWDYAFDLADALESAVQCPVDVRVINDAPLPFRYNVSRGVPLVVHDPEAFYTFLERTWDDWLDFKPIAMRYLEEMA